MMNQSFEGNNGLLPSGHGLGTTTNDLYGTTPIPTLLGNDGGAAGDYLNDHPVGPYANIIAVAGSATGTTGPGTGNLIYSCTGGCGVGSNSITWSTAGNYTTFVDNYGYPAVQGMSVDALNVVPYVTCITCHNQHLMNVYKSKAAGNGQANGIAAYAANSTFVTYFFINAPYNGGAVWSYAAAPSTTQFCRQCHFSESNEYMGGSVQTAF